MSNLLSEEFCLNMTNIPKNELKREQRREGFETGNADRHI